MESSVLFFVLPHYALIMVLLVLSVARPTHGQGGNGNIKSPAPQYPQPGTGWQPSGQQRPEVVYDQGLQMPIGSYDLPEGWKIVQDIATSPFTGQPMKQKLDLLGPRGELIRSLGFRQYPPMYGKDFEQRWQQTAMGGLQSELQQVSFGSLQPDTRIQRNETVQEHLRMAARRGFEIQWLKAAISGSRYGQTYRGMVFILHTKAPNLPHMETLQVDVAISPAHQLSQTLAVYEGVDNSFQPNPQYEQRLRRIQRQQMKNFGVLGDHGADHQHQKQPLSS